jgi:hypothetical protein
MRIWNTKLVDWYVDMISMYFFTVYLFHFKDSCYTALNHFTALHLLIIWDLLVVWKHPILTKKSCIILTMSEFNIFIVKRITSRQYFWSKSFCSCTIHQLDSTESNHSFLEVPTHSKLFAWKKQLLLLFFHNKISTNTRRSKTTMSKVMHPPAQEYIMAIPTK